MQKRAGRILDLFIMDHSFTYELIRRSFLREEVKDTYSRLYGEKLKALNYSFNENQSAEASSKRAAFYA